MKVHLRVSWQRISRTVFRICLVAVGGLLAGTSSLEAAVVPSGDVEPAMPWSSGVSGYIGMSSGGSLSIDAGSQLQSRNASIGYATGARGSVTITGSGSMWTDSRALYVGYSGSGTLNVQAGGQVSSYYNDYLGYHSGSTGVATVTGAGSMWNNFGDLYVGNSGSGTLTVSDGGLVETATLFASLGDLYGNGAIAATQGAVLDADLRFDSTHGTQQALAFGSGGTLTVTFAPGGSLGAGFRGQGSLSVADGLAIASSTGYLGYNSGSTGVATVTGSGSTWTNSSDLNVGYSGNGTLNVQAGGQVSSNLLNVGYSGNGTLNVQAGGQVSSSLFFVGNSSSGTLNVQAGGQVSSSYGFLGYYFGSTGVATVTGPGSIWNNSGDLYVGDYGSGTLNVQAGGQVSSSEGYLGYYSSSTGAATVIGAGSMWNNSGDLYVGYSGSGTLTVSDGGLVETATLFASLGDLYGNGTIAATQGAVLDADLRFDSTHGTQQALAFGSGGTLAITSAPGGSLGAGFRGQGSLTVADGVAITSGTGYLGYYFGSTGVATVTGSGSTWNNSSDLYVGDYGSGTLNVLAGGRVSSSSLYVGNSGNGTLNVLAGGQVSSSYGYLGCLSTGVATVTGPGSTWNNSSFLFVGFSGSGTLNVLAGGQVSSSYGYLGYRAGSTGMATVTGSGSTWKNIGDLYVGDSGSGTLTVSDGGLVKTANLYASLGDLYGNGTIAATQGAVLDASLRFDSTHGTQQALAFGSGGTLAVTFAPGGLLGAGFRDQGSLTVADGVAITSSVGYLGYNPGSMGVATVTGSGSTWTNSRHLFIGYYGNGTLNVQAGGQASSSNGYLGYESGSTGVATVTGSGSMWTISRALGVGVFGSGTLNVLAGGQVAAPSVAVNSTSQLNIDVGCGSRLVVGGGTGTITNGGTISILAGANAADNSQYAPLAAKTFSGAGTYQAVGGTWNSASHTFTASPVLHGASGTPLSIDLSVRQRLLVSDSTSGWSVGASLLAMTGSDKIATFTATALGPDELTSLTPLLAGDETLLGAWDFAVGGSGYRPGNPVYLSFPAETTLSEADVHVWHWDGTAWSRFTPGDLNCSQGYANFTAANFSATSFSGYAVTTVPEPSTLALLAGAALLPLALRRKSR